MRVSWNWLKEFVEVDDAPYSVAERLTLAGLEVESIERVGQDLAGIVVGEVLAVAPVPGLDGWFQCEVRTGSEVTCTVISSLQGLRAGVRVAWAPVGVRLSTGRRVEYEPVGSLRSFGHLCSEADLGLGSDVSRVLELGQNAPIGASVVDLLRLDDYLLEVAVTPNRGDCLSILGIAREISALTGARLKRPRFRFKEQGSPTPHWIGVRIADEIGCRRYVARVIRGVRVGPSPLWLQVRLRHVGLRPANNVVDVTNYVLWERGQPLHAFDYDRLPAKEIVVDHARLPFRFETLDGAKHEIVDGDLLILAGDTPVALAGIIGGANSCVQEDTTTVLLESAWFSPTMIRRTARRLGLRTEAAYRFERGVDIEGVASAADRAAAMIAELAGGELSGQRVEVYLPAAPPAPIALRLRRLAEWLGMDVPRAQVTLVLKRLGMEVSAAPHGTLNVVPPSYRSDLEREIDLVEEVARVVGYDEIPSELPSGAVASRGLGAVEIASRSVRRFLVAQGFFEAVPLAFASSEENARFPGWVPERKAVVLRNPLSQNDAEMRLSLLSSLLRATRHNLAQGAERVALFSLGKVFWSGAEAGERLHVGAVVCPHFLEEGVGVRGNRTGFADVKGVVQSLLEILGIQDRVTWQRATCSPWLHPGRSAELLVDGKIFGALGALHPDLEVLCDVPSPCWLFELDLETGLQYRPRRVTFREWPRFPEVKRDLAIVADGQFPAGEVVRFVEAHKDSIPWVEDIAVVDEYAGPPIPAGKKSLTYAISYRAVDRTLTDAEVNAAHTELTRRIVEHFGVLPR